MRLLRAWLSLRAASVRQSVFATVIFVVVPLTLSSAALRAQSLAETSLMYLQRHGAPCEAVVKIGTTDELDEVATCCNGSEWVILWLDDEVALVDPRSRELYRWHRDGEGWNPDVVKSSTSSLC